MANAQLKFSFEIQGFDKDAFHVVRFSGEEGISQLYHFEIELFASDMDVDFEKALSNTATFSIKRKLGDIPFHGILKTFEQLSHSGPYTFYRAVLVPKAWWLTQTTHNQVFLNQNNEHFLTAVLKDGGLSPGLDFKLSLQGSYPTWEYICQYDETHFDFASRWMERDGLYYFFQQGSTGEKMVITDSLTSHGPMPQGETFRYSPPSSMQVGHEEEVLTDFTLTQRRLPKKVQLKDYNYQTPSLELSAETLVSQSGQGIHYLYGLHFMNTSQGEALAKIRAEDFRCREKLFNGVSSIPFVRPGYTFKIDNHYRGSFNQSYQTIACRHEGSQEAWLVSGLGLTFSKERDNLLFYRNSFTAIPASVQFRAELCTERPKISGTLNAKVDAASSGQYAEVDSQGRYKVILPFDLSGRKDGHASAWVRMAQPYAGAGFGMHMPLHKGCEVLITFEGGDPDRPVIAAAVPNPETTSPVTDQNQTQACITTSGGNQIHIQDQEGSQRILLSSPTQQSFVRIGSHNDPDDGYVKGDHSGNWEQAEDPDGLKLYSGGPLTVKASESFEVILGNKNEITLGALTDNVIGERLITTIALFQEIDLTKHVRFGPEIHELWPAMKKAAADREDAIANLRRDIVTNTESIAEHQRFVTACYEVLEEHEATIASHQQKIGTLNRTVGEQTDTIESHQRFITACQEILEEHDTTIATHTRQIATHDETIGTHSRQIGDIDDIAGNVSWMYGALDALATDVDWVIANMNVV
ncbi:MAG: type VI secretion system tip protein VgrG [Desulfovibrio sp.]|nr:type VI secretion system tip protein VgrG [Desulfovibrio sp.]MBI4959097.1 type VI secretion system tip protein VgrG [Desulfovibrio sp.]